MKINVLHFQWGAGDHDEVFSGGVHDEESAPSLKNPTKKLLRSIAAAEAAGAVEVLDCTPEERATLDEAVQSQEEGEKVYAELVQGDEWRRGNLEQFVVAADDQLAYHDSLEHDHPDRLTADRKSLLEAQRDEAKAALDELDGGSEKTEKKGGKG